MKKETTLNDVIKSLDEAETKCVAKYVSHYTEDNEFEDMGSAWLNAFNSIAKETREADRKNQTTETSKKKTKEKPDDEVEILTPDAVLDADGNVIA